MEEKMLTSPITAANPTLQSASEEILLSRSANIRIGVALATTALAIPWIGRSTDIKLQLADAVYDQKTSRRLICPFGRSHEQLFHPFGPGDDRHQMNIQRQEIDRISEYFWIRQALLRKQWKHVRNETF
jgi:hypothetical protein